LKRDGTGFAAAGGAESKKVRFLSLSFFSKLERKEENEDDGADLRVSLVSPVRYCFPVDWEGGRGRRETRWHETSSFSLSDFEK